MHGLPARLAPLLAIWLFVVGLYGDPIPVGHPQGSAHGFLEIVTLAGVQIAVGDYVQTLHGDVVTCRVVFHFRDGSIDDEQTRFTQHKNFRLLSDRHIQRGPSFPHSIDVLIDARTGTVTSHTEDGRVEEEHLEIPADVANGLPPNLLLNMPPTVPESKVSYVAPTAKPRLIHISIKPAGQVSFTVGGTRRKATDYVLHVELGGVTGIIAPMIGKQPSDFHIWILGGTMPAFIREEGQFYEGGPVWRVEQISPVFSR